MALSGQSTTIAHPSLTWEEQLSLLCGTTFCVPHPDRGQKAQQKQRCSSSKPVNTVQVGSNVDDLIQRGWLQANSRRDFARSAIGVAIASGVATPDISSGSALRQALLNTRSIVLSSGPSSAYRNS